MTGETALMLVGFAGYLVMSAFYSGVEIGVYQVNRARLRYRSEEGDRRARLLLRLLRRPELLLATLLVGQNLAAYLATAIMTESLARVVETDQQVQLLSTAVVAPLLFVFAEATPKNLFRAGADRLTPAAGRVLTVSWILFLPAGLLLAGLSRAVSRLLHAPGRPDTGFFGHRELRRNLAEGVADGVLSGLQGRMAEAVLNLGTRPLREVMIPWDQVHGLDESAGRDQVLALAAETGHARFPVSRGGLGGPVLRDQPVGMVTVHDLLYGEADLGAGRGGVEEVLREVPRLQATLPVDDALVAMRRARTPAAVVVDRTDAAVGWITVKDLVEEITGDLQEW